MQRLSRSLATATKNDRTVLAALAEAHMHAGRLKTAGRWWWRMTRQNAQDHSAWAGVIVCALAAGKLSLARRAMRTLIAQSSPAERRQTICELWCHAVVGDAVTRTKRTKRKEKPVEQAEPSALAAMVGKAAHTLDLHARRFPNRADAHYHLAVCQDALDDDDAARWSLNEALRVNPGYERARQLNQRLAA